MTNDEPLPPALDGWPLLGNAPGILREGGAFYERAADRGDVVRISLPGLGEQVLCTHPDQAERVLTDDGYRKARFVLDRLDDLLGRGLIHSEGALWRRQRRRIQPLFAADRVGTYAETMRRTVAAFVDETDDGAVLDLERTARALSLRILLRTVFGDERPESVPRLLDALDDVRRAGRLSAQPIVQFVPPWVPVPVWRRFHRGVDRIDRYVRELIADRRSGGPTDGDDVLARLLAVADEGDGPPDGAGESPTDDGSDDPQDAAGEGPLDDGGEAQLDHRGGDELLRDELVSLLFAGHDTTAVTIAVALHQLCRDRNAMDRARADAERALESAPDGDPPTSAAALPVVDGVVLEAARLVPPIPNVYREPTSDVVLDGYRVPAGTPVAASIWAIHRDGRWYDDPGSFRPERWRGDERDRPRLAYCPFGGGKRRCVARAFAEVEARVVLATLLASCELELVEERPLDPSVTITTQLSGDHEIRLRRR